MLLGVAIFVLLAFDIYTVIEMRKIQAQIKRFIKLR